jgi:hypothetical protein
MARFVLGLHIVGCFALRGGVLAFVMSLALPQPTLLLRICDHRRT